MEFLAKKSKILGKNQIFGQQKIKFGPKNNKSAKKVKCWPIKIKFRSNKK